MENVISRLNNWKFATAYRYAKEIADDINDDIILENIESLAETFGNIGWFAGHMSNIVALAVDSIVKELEYI